MFFMILLGVAAGLVIYALFPDLKKGAYIGIRLLILPLIVGIGYEFIMYAGKHNGILVRILAAPGLWVQRLTTKEPTADMLEVAIISTKFALRDENPEFMQFFNDFYAPKSEEPVQTKVSADEAASAPIAEASDECESAVVDGQTAHLAKED